MGVELKGRTREITLDMVMEDGYYEVVKLGYDGLSTMPGDIILRLSDSVINITREFIMSLHIDEIVVRKIEAGSVIEITVE